MEYHHLCVWCCMFLLTLQECAAGSMKELPTECISATKLDEVSRDFDNYKSPTSRANDEGLEQGWYRFVGKGGNGLKQGYPKPLLSGRTPPNFCGTEYAGTLLGEHPTEQEGAVEMTVCFRRRYCFFQNRDCGCDKSIKVFVRNCRKYYIYWLSPTLENQRYCTGRNRLTGAKVTNGVSDAVECTQYKVFDSKNFMWDEVSDVTCKSYVGWHRYLENAGSELASSCSPNHKPTTRLGQSCGAEFRGWMVDKHPTIQEGRVQRKICFSYSDHCLCDFYSNIAVRNCGKFYVYRLTALPTCTARYCGAPKDNKASVSDANKTDIIIPDNICKTDTEKMYEVVYDPDRLWSYTSPNVKKCDSYLYGRYRFGSKYTPWSIKEGCNETEMSIVRHRCGAVLQGFMKGKHPEVNEGYVERVICFQKASIPCECQHTAVVGVKNCGGYYVYNFKSVPACDARFCMVANGTTKITIDAGRPPLHELPKPGYAPVVGKSQKKDGDDSDELVATTTILAIILFIVIILLIVVILVFLFIAWPIYKRRRRNRPRDSRDHVNVAVHDNHTGPSKPTGSDSYLPNCDKEREMDEAPIPPYPSVPPPSKPPQTAPPFEEDSEIEMRKGPGSDDDLNTIPEDAEDDDIGNEADTLMKKADVKKPNSYENSHKDSTV